MSLTSISFRLPTDYVNLIRETSKAQQITQADVIKRALDTRINADSIQLFSQGGVMDINPEVSNEELEMLKNLGISTAAGIAGYHLTGVIRKKMELSEDTGIQMAFGACIGLVTLLLTLSKSE